MLPGATTVLAKVAAFTTPPGAIDVKGGVKLGEGAEEEADGLTPTRIPNEALKQNRLCPAKSTASPPAVLPCNTRARAAIPGFTKPPPASASVRQTPFEILTMLIIVPPYTDEV